MSELNKKLGDLLRLERERRGLKLDKISGELKIPEATLRALEDGDPSAMPSELYFKLFAKSYAEHLGIDYTRTLEAMREELGILETPEPVAVAGTKKPEAAKAPSKKRPPEDEGERDNSRMLKRLSWLGGSILGAFVVFVAIYFFFLRDSSPQTGAVDESQPGQTVEHEGEGGNLAERYNWETPAIRESDSLVLTLSAREPSWATVLADGDTALYQRLNPARDYRIAAKYRLLVSIGVPRFVEAKLNDKPAFLADAESGRISRVEINQVNREKFAAPPQAERPTRVSAIEASPDTTADSGSATQGVENW